MKHRLATIGLACVGALMFAAPCLAYAPPETDPRIVVTTGGLQGFVFYAEELLAERPGRVLVEAPTYDRPLTILKGLGAEVVAVPMDDEGLDPDALARFVGRVLIVTGELDSIAPPEALGALAARARRGHFAVIPNCDHFFGVGLAELGREVSGWLAGGPR